MELEKRYITNNPHYKNNRIIQVKGLVLHSVGCSQPSPEVFVNVWNKSDSKYPAQIVIGTDKAYEVLPCMETPGKAVFTYHVGSANSYTIGAEMTEPSTIKYTGSGANWQDLDQVKTYNHVIRTYNNAVNIFAQLCKFHNLNPLQDGVILSHRECAIRGIGTSHADVEHIWQKFGMNMNKFRQDVNTELNKLIEEDEDMTQEKFNEMLFVAMDAYRKSLQDNDAGAWSQDARDWAVSTGLIKGGTPLPNGKPNYMWEDFLTREQMATLLWRFKDIV